MKILMVASEATPYAKTGGLADVIGALSPTLHAQGHEVAVLMPRYRSVPVEGLPVVYQGLTILLGAEGFTADIYRAEERGVTYFLMDCPALYDREFLYGDAAGDYPDNHVRFAALSRAALMMIRDVFRPHVVHCHDWQSALVPIYARTLYSSDPTYLGLPVILTIHNLGYQGIFPAAVLPEIGLPPTTFTPDLLEFFKNINLLKGAIVTADMITTVSPTYAREIQTPELGFGLDGVLRSRSGAVTGILNGVDYTRWDPATDPVLAANYSPEDLSGKRFSKADLLAAFGLPPERIERPLVGMVSRLAGQKGFDLIAQSGAEMLSLDVSFVVLGAGDPDYQLMLEELHAAFPDQAAVRFGYDDPLAHKIEAGSDMFLMPSLYEPCGLNQIYSLGYGTVPIVRATGGLDDTIDESTGFKFVEYTGTAMLGAISEAVRAYSDRERWVSMMLAGMRKDFSWNASAARYSELYSRLSG